MKKRKKKALIIGTNIAKKIHYKILKRFYRSVYIISRSTKTIVSGKKYTSYKILLKEKIFEHITICSTYKVQENFIKFMLANNIKTKKIMFEKPMITDLNLLNKLNKYCLKNKILIRVNYTFNEIKFLKKIIPLLTEKKSKLIYTLSFNHPFYENKKKIWKNQSAQGGGIINYYLSHIIFYFQNFKFENKNLKIEVFLKKNIIVKIKLIFGKFIELICKPNSSYKSHNVSFKNSWISLNISNTSNDWFGNFIMIMTKKKITKKLVKKENILNLTYKNYKNLIENRFNKVDFIDYFKKLYNCSENINNFKKKIAKNVFKKVQIL